MPSEKLFPLSDVLRSAEARGYGVGAFNVSTLDQAVSVLEAANLSRSPVIVQAIAGVHAYRSDEAFWRMLRALVLSEADVPVVLHLDHGNKFDDCRRAIDAGFTSVMRDASRDPVSGKPLSFEENVNETLRVIEVANAAGVSVEGEIGTIGSGGEGLGAGGAFDFAISDKDEAVRFIDATGVDALGLAVGTSHGSVKFPLGRQPALDFALIEAVHGVRPDVGLVLHGSSSVFAENVDRINACGGSVRPSQGISAADKQHAIAVGIRKINQGTDSHHAFSAAVRGHLHDHPEDVDPVFYLGPGITGMRAAVQEAIYTFGSDGHADSI